MNIANEKKVALVTGSDRRIGVETARQLGQQGVSVIVSARTEREAADAADAAICAAKASKQRHLRST